MAAIIARTMAAVEVSTRGWALGWASARDSASVWALAAATVAAMAAVDIRDTMAATMGDIMAAVIRDTTGTTGTRATATGIIGVEKEKITSKQIKCFFVAFFCLFLDRIDSSSCVSCIHSFIHSFIICLLSLID